MPAATATAVGGQVRAQALRRTCWRLAVLLGLSWTALLLLGGTAHAACDEPTCEQPSGSSGPGAAPDVPLVGRLLAGVDEPAGKPLQKVTDLTTTALHGLRGTTPAADPVPADAADEVDAMPALPDAGTFAAAPAGPAAITADPVELVTSTVRGAVHATGDRLLLEDLPSVRTTVTPLVDGLARQLVDTADATVDAVEVLTAPLPLAGGLTPALRTAVDTLSLTTRLVVEATGTVTGSVDRVVGEVGGVTAALLSPVVEAVEDATGPAGDAAGTGTGGGSSPAADSAGPALSLGVVMVRGEAPHTDRDSDTRTLPGPAVPPPDATDLLPAVQPAADTVTALPVPVSGAGSISGNGGATSAPRPDHPLARVVPGPAGSHGATAPVACPTGAMPGTPAADPAFSPD